MLHDAVQDVGLKLLLLSPGGALRGSLKKTNIKGKVSNSHVRVFPIHASGMWVHVLTSSSISMMGVCLLAGVMQRLSMIRTLMKSKTYFLAGWLVRDVLEPTLQYSDWLRFMPESPVKALNSSVGELASSSKSLTYKECDLYQDHLS